MDQQDHHVWLLRAHAFGVPEFRHDGEGASRRRKKSRCSSRSATRLLPEVFGPAWVPPVSDGSGQDRKLLRSAGDLLNAAGWTIKDGKRVTPKAKQLKDRVPARPSARSSRTMRPSSRIFGILGIDASVRLVDPVQCRRADEGFRFRHHHRSASSIRRPPEARCATIFPAQFASDQGLQQSRRDCRSGRSTRWSKRQLRRRDQSRPDIGVPRPRPGASRSGRYWMPHWNKASHPDRLLGPVRPSAGKPRYAQASGAGDAGGPRPARRPSSSRRNRHERIYRPPHSPDDSHAAGNPVRLLCRGAVRAGRAGRAGDRAAQRRRHRRQLADFGLLRRRFRRPHPGRRLRRRGRFEIPRRAGARSRFRQEPGEAVRLRQAGAGTLCADAVEFRAVRFRQELFPRRQRAATDQGEAAGLDVARASG